MGVLPAFITALVPSRLDIATNEFVYPLVEVLSRLLAVSTGAGGAFEPCHELAVSAASCAGVLLHRLVAYTINLDCVDILNTRPERPPAESNYLTNPLWTPFVSWRDILERTSPQAMWNQPSPESFALAEHAAKALLLPTLAQVSAATAELEAYVTSGDKQPPQLPNTSGQSSISQQRQYIVDLVTWTHLLGIGLFEALKPRTVTQADAESVRQVCAELDLMRTEAVTVPAAGVNPVHLDFPWFDIPVEVETGGTVCLREHIFRVGLRLLDVFAKLSNKYDELVADSSSKLRS